jgi:hypothetical protein
MWRGTGKNAYMWVLRATDAGALSQTTPSNWQSVSRRSSFIPAKHSNLPYLLSSS